MTDLENCLADLRAQGYEPWTEQDGSKTWVGPGDDYETSWAFDTYGSLLYWSNGYRKVHLTRDKRIADYARAVRREELHNVLYEIQSLGEDPESPEDMQRILEICREARRTVAERRRENRWRDEPCYLASEREACGTCDGGGCWDCK